MYVHAGLVAIHKHDNNLYQKRTENISLKRLCVQQINEAGGLEKQEYTLFYVALDTRKGGSLNS